MTKTTADSSVWIDFLAGRRTAQAKMLRGLIEADQIFVADVIAMEVLRGISDDLEHARIRRLIHTFPVNPAAAKETVLRAGENFRFLRKRGYTIRSVVDCVLATYCIDNGFQLLHNDRDFHPFEEYLGLQVLRP